MSKKEPILDELDTISAQLSRLATPERYIEDRISDLETSIIESLKSIVHLQNRVFDLEDEVTTLKAAKQIPPSS